MKAFLLAGALMLGGAAVAQTTNTGTHSGMNHGNTGSTMSSSQSGSTSQPGTTTGSSMTQNPAMGQQGTMGSQGGMTGQGSNMGQQGSTMNQGGMQQGRSTGSYAGVGGPDMSDMACVPAGFNQGLSVYPQCGEVARPTHGGDYPRCSRTVTDHCMQGSGRRR